MQDNAVIRLIDGRLGWYPAGAGEQLCWLDEAGATEQLRDLVRQRRSAIIFAVPGADVRLQRLLITADEKKHLAKALPYMLEEELAADVEQLHFAYTELDKLSFTVAVCSTDKMHQWQTALGEFAGLARWVPEPLLLPWQPGEWCVVLEDGIAMVRIAEGEGFCIEREMLTTVLDAALAVSDGPSVLVMYGQNQQDDCALVSPVLAEQLQWRRGGFHSAQLLTVDNTAGVNLLQGEFAARLPLGRWWRQWRTVAAVFAVAFCTQLTATYLEYRSLEQQNLQLRQAMEHSYRQIIPRGAVPRPEKQLRDELNALRGSAQSGGFVSLMNKVGEIVAAKPGTSIATINYNDKSGEMRMHIIAANFEAVEAIRAAMIAAGMQAVMENSNAQGEQVRARIRVGVSA